MPVTSADFFPMTLSTTDLYCALVHRLIRTWAEAIITNSTRVLLIQCKELSQIKASRVSHRWEKPIRSRLRNEMMEGQVDVMNFPRLRHLLPETAQDNGLSILPFRLGFSAHNQWDSPSLPLSVCLSVSLKSARSIDRDSETNRWKPKWTPASDGRRFP